MYRGYGGISFVMHSRTGSPQYLAIMVIFEPGTLAGKCDYLRVIFVAFLRGTFYFLYKAVSFSFLQEQNDAQSFTE